MLEQDDYYDYTAFSPRQQQILVVSFAEKIICTVNAVVIRTIILTSYPKLLYLLLLERDVIRCCSKVVLVLVRGHDETSTHQHDTTSAHQHEVQEPLV